MYVRLVTTWEMQENLRRRKLCDCVCKCVCVRVCVEQIPPHSHPWTTKPHTLTQVTSPCCLLYYLYTYLPCLPAALLLFLLGHLRLQTIHDTTHCKDLNQHLCHPNFINYRKSSPALLIDTYEYILYSIQTTREI